MNKLFDMKRLAVLLRAAAALVAAQLGGMLLWSALGGSGDNVVYKLLMDVLCIQAVNTVMFLLICGGIKLPERSTSYSRWEVPAFLLAAMLVGSAATLLWRSLITAERMDGEPLRSVAEKAIYVVYVVIVSPVAEEVAFRGAALTRLRTAFGEFGAALVSAVLFAVYHMDISTFAYTLVLGFFYAMLAQRSGSLFPSILVHAANNVVVLLVRLFEPFAKVVDVAVPVLGMVAILWLLVTKRMFSCRVESEN